MPKRTRDGRFLILYNHLEEQAYAPVGGAAALPEQDGHVGYDADMEDDEAERELPRKRSKLNY